MITTIKDMDNTPRREFMTRLFDKITDENSNFMWQLFFYVLKRIHIPLLFLIFVFGIKNINIYYIGLLYFFIRYISSLVAYRKSGKTLVAYASFFICF